MKAVVLASLIGVLLIGTSSEAQTPTAQGAKRGASKGSDPFFGPLGTIHERLLGDARAHRSSLSNISASTTRSSALDSAVNLPAARSFVLKTLMCS
jgi:hypothetical protein